MSPDPTMVKWGVGLFVVSFYLLTGGTPGAVIFGGLGMIWGGGLVWEEYKAWRK